MLIYFSHTSGQPLATPHITHQQILQGGDLVLQLSQDRTTWTILDDSRTNNSSSVGVSVILILFVALSMLCMARLASEESKVMHTQQGRYA